MFPVILVAGESRSLAQVNHLGFYECEEAAARAYDAAVLTIKAPNHPTNFSYASSEHPLVSQRTITTTSPRCGLSSTIVESLPRINVNTKCARPAIRPVLCRMHPRTTPMHYMRTCILEDSRINLKASRQYALQTLFSWPMQLLHPTWTMCKLGLVKTATR
jgi:hypothetical protein